MTDNTPPPLSPNRKALAKYAYKVHYEYGRKRSKNFHNREALIKFYAANETLRKNIARIAIPGEGDKSTLKNGAETLDGLMREFELMGQILRLEEELQTVRLEAGAGARKTRLPG